MRRNAPLVAFAVISLLLIACASEDPPSTPEPSQEATKEFVRSWIISMWDQGDRDVFDRLATDGYVYRIPGQPDLSGDAFFEYADSIRAAIPDLNNTIEEQFVDGDMVVTRGTTRGTHDGAFGAIEATGNSIEVPWVMFTRLRGGKVAEEWEIFDTLAFMTQLDAVTTPE